MPLLRRSITNLIKPFKMVAPGLNGALTSTMPTYTVTGLKRWSCLDAVLPPASRIKAIHVYDFDNTLFKTPLPNRKLWNIQTVGALSNPDFCVGGGWWHDANILESTGEGIEKEEPRAWKGWWNEQIVELVELSMQQKDALNVLMTGRAEGRFGELIKRMARSRNLAFDMICLKQAVGPQSQKFKSTMDYKQAVLRDLVYTYSDAEEIRIYEDRPHHTEAFRNFFFDFNKALQSADRPIDRNPITTEVIQVNEVAAQLDPVTEVAEVQRMINAHNMAVRIQSPEDTTLKPKYIKRQVHLTAYLVDQSDAARLYTLVPNPSPGHREWRWLANSILIQPGPYCRENTLARVGGIGHKVTWRVVAMGSYENKVWSAKVEPVDPNESVYTYENQSSVVLATFRSTPRDANRIQNWQPVSQDQALEFVGTVGEKVTLAVEDEPSNGNNAFHPNRARKHPRDDAVQYQDEYPPLDDRSNGNRGGYGNGYGNYSGNSNAPRDNGYKDRQPEQGHRDNRENNYQSYRPNDRTNDRRDQYDDRRPFSNQYRGGNNNRGRGYNNNFRGGRGGSSRGGFDNRRTSGGGPPRGRGRGGQHQYQDPDASGPPRGGYNDYDGGYGNQGGYGGGGMQY